jgi:hypothetical protein
MATPATLLASVMHTVVLWNAVIVRSVAATVVRVVFLERDQAYYKHVLSLHYSKALDPIEIVME